MATILVVDDHDALLTLFRVVLTKAGYEVLTATSAGAAVEIARKGAWFDVLITDMIMPGILSGEDLAEVLCASRPDLPVILMSGYPQNPVRSRENWRYLEKPFDSHKLLDMIRTALGEVLGDR